MRSKTADNTCATCAGRNLLEEFCFSAVYRPKGHVIHVSVAKGPSSEAVPCFIDGKLGMERCQVGADGRRRDRDDRRPFQCDDFGVFAESGRARLPLDVGDFDLVVRRLDCLSLDGLPGNRSSRRIRTRPQRALLTVPELGVRPGNEVWLMRDGRLHVEPVRIVRVSDGVAVIDGVAGTVQPGDRLITTSVPGARDGLPVTEADKGSRQGAKTQRDGE